MSGHILVPAPAIKWLIESFDLSLLYAYYFITMLFEKNDPAKISIDLLHKMSYKL
jgi:hypothetical protein